MRIPQRLVGMFFIETGSAPVIVKVSLVQSPILGRDVSKYMKSNLSCSISEAALLMVNVYVAEVPVSCLLVLKERDVPQLEVEESLTVSGLMVPWTHVTHSEKKAYIGKQWIFHYSLSNVGFQ